MSEEAQDKSPAARSRVEWRRYVASLAIVLAAILIRYLAHSWLGNAGFFLFWTAALVASWMGGFGPAILTQTIIIAAEAWWFSERIDPPFPSTLTDLMILISFYAVGGTIGLMSDLRRAALRQASAEHEESLSQREQLRATLSCMADGVLVADLKGRITLMNPAAEELTAWNMEEASGKSLWEVFSIRGEDSALPVASSIERVLKDGDTVKDASRLWLMPRLGGPIPIAYSAAPVRASQGEVTAAVLIFRDESERRRNEQSLRKADKRKDEFLATLAHELRNPLAPICTGLELLENSSDDPAASAEIRAMLGRQSRHMVRLIDDLLDVSRITRGKLELRSANINLAEVVGNAVDSARPMIDHSRQLLVVKLPERPVHLYADPNRLTQILSNLLNNASKFTPPEGRIELTASQEGSTVTVDVVDNGIGIPADKLDDIFDMFTQVSASTDRMQSGLGIGLTLVRRLVELHGGTVQARSAGEKLGSKFSVRLPVLPAPVGTPNSDGAADHAVVPIATNRRVLVVDDNQDALESLSQLVAVMGNVVCRANDGLEAIATAESFRPDIVLMDLGMPRLDGYEAAKRIRQAPWGRAVTLVATSGWGQEEHRRRSREAGFDHHLVKPVDVASLRSILHAPRPVNDRVGILADVE